jgi:hypothetical protein
LLTELLFFIPKVNKKEIISIKFEKYSKKTVKHLTVALKRKTAAMN